MFYYDEKVAKDNGLTEMRVNKKKKKEKRL